MATVEVKCGECGFPQQVDEAALGTTVKCPKCKDTFYAETGDAYGLADEPADAPVVDRRAASAGGDNAPRPRPIPTAKPAARKPEPRPRKESKEERALRERMEKWAEKMDE